MSRIYLYGQTVKNRFISKKNLVRIFLLSFFEIKIGIYYFASAKRLSTSFQFITLKKAWI